MVELHNVISRLHKWCHKKGISVRNVCNEDTLSGILVPSVSSTYVMRYLTRLIGENRTINIGKVNAGPQTLIAISDTTITDGTMRTLIPKPSILEQRISNVLGTECIAIVEHAHTKRPNNIADKINESLDGIAADNQPSEMMSRLSSAMRDVGLIDALHKANITNKLSSDGQVISFYIVDADGREREIQSYELTKLGNGNNLEKVLKDLRDLSQHRAPGTTDRQLQRVRDAEQTLRNIAKKYTPQDEEASDATR